MAADRSFLGTGWAFPPEFHKRAKDVKMVSTDDDIRESLTILLSTSPGERVMRPDYGCGLKTMVFETVTETRVAQIHDIVERAVLFYEPRITLHGVEVNTDEVFDGLIKITLHYTIRTTNIRSNMVFPFYLREGTDIKS